MNKTLEAGRSKECFSVFFRFKSSKSVLVMIFQQLVVLYTLMLK